MTRTEAWLNHASTLAVGGTGLVYGWMRYLCEPVDEFAIVNHPWQPHLQHLHVLLAPVLVFAAGLVFRTHALKRLASPRSTRRRTGWTLLLSLLPMIASGYLLQVASDEVWRSVWIVVHVATSLAWLAGYAVHQLQPRDAVSGVRGLTGPSRESTASSSRLE